MHESKTRSRLSPVVLLCVRLPSIQIYCPLSFFSARSQTNVSTSGNETFAFDTSDLRLLQMSFWGRFLQVCQGLRRGPGGFLSLLPLTATLSAHGLLDHKTKPESQESFESNESNDSCGEGQQQKKHLCLESSRLHKSRECWSFSMLTC